MGSGFSLEPFGHLGLDIMYFVNAYLVSKRFIGNTIITICFSSIMIVHTCDYLYLFVSTLAIV